MKLSSYHPKYLAELFAFLFIFSGSLKGLPLLSSLNQRLDLTILFGAVASIYCVTIVVFRQRLFLPSQLGIFLLTLLLFILYSTLSFVMTESTVDAVKKAIQFQMLTPIAVIVALVLLDNVQAIKRFFIYTAIFGFLIGVYGFFIPKNFNTGGMFGAESGYQWMSKISFYALIFCLGLLFDAKSKKGRWLWGVAIMPCFYGLISGGARQTIFGLIVVGIYLVFVYAKPIKKPINSKLLFAFLIISAFVTVGVMSIGDFALLDGRGANRIGDFITLLIKLDFTAILEMSGRLHLFVDGINIFQDHPLFGVGFGNFREFASSDVYSHPHNVFLEVLAELGVFGLFFFCCLLIPILIHVFGNCSIKSTQTVFLGAMVLGNLATMMASGDLGTNRIFFFFCTLFLISLARSKVVKK